MAIKNILVAFNGSESSEAALRTAILMHQKHGCHVTGLLVHAGQREKLSTHSWVPESVRKTIAKKVREIEQSFEAKFRDLVGDAVPADQLHWISLFGDSDATVAKYARMYDLTIVGRYDAVDGRADLELHPEEIALKSGRPVFVIPRGHAPKRIRERAVVAWDGQRAATRAVTDAMQILESKQQVDVLSIEDGSVRPSLPGIDVATALTRHGINVKRVRRDPAGARVAADILAYCEEVEAGMLVIGAYEHSVFRERLMGGSTQYILQHAKLPVLMSH
ncbi:universal stress protein [Cognatishimia sp. SS12]|uniref:universal stress protein n=1 Tax=Cognatishimia sp. SS12 TaxID=2979465 RepID=UPI00232A8027|nr:universal stress protein [Cognatishimia sp. SS12]MDC0739549.1 universal stress protein [Cognatishimia sp. SS12]